MFENTGKKIKSLAYIFFILGVIASIICGGSIMYKSPGAGGFGIIIVGIIGSWISSLLLYGFGKIVENTDKLVEQGEREEIKSTKEIEEIDEIDEIDEEEAIRIVKRMSKEK